MILVSYQGCESDLLGVWECSVGCVRVSFWECESVLLGVWECSVGCVRVSFWECESVLLGVWECLVRNMRVSSQKSIRNVHLFSSAEEGEIQEEQAYCSSVRPEEIPKIPENKFLMRGSQDEKPPERWVLLFTLIIVGALSKISHTVQVVTWHK